MVYKTTNISPFEVVYSFNPHTPLNLLPLPNPHEFMHKEEGMMVKALTQDQPLELCQGGYKKIETLLQIAETLSYTC